MSGTVVTQCKTRQYLKLRKEEVEMEKQGRKGKQGDSVSQHRWQQSQHDAALLLPRGLQAS